MFLIFSASGDQMSGQRTSRFIGPFLRWFKPDISPAAISRVQGVVRKTAHVVEYAILAVLLWRALRKPQKGQWGPWSHRVGLMAFALATLYAITDEFHQSFVPSRQGQFTDVLLDSFGAALGLFALWLLGRLRNHW